MPPTTATAPTSPWHDLRGNAVAAPQRSGIYIRKGHKYVIKK